MITLCLPLTNAVSQSQSWWRRTKDAGCSVLGAGHGVDDDSMRKEVQAQKVHSQCKGVAGLLRFYHPTAPLACAFMCIGFRWDHRGEAVRWQSISMPRKWAAAKKEVHIVSFEILIRVSLFQLTEFIVEFSMRASWRTKWSFRTVSKSKWM